MPASVYMVGAGEIARRRLRSPAERRRKEHETVAAPEESPSASVQALRSAHDPTTILVVISGQIDRSDARRLADRVHELLASKPAKTLICDLAGITRSDAAVVDAVCRIRVAGLRHRCQVVLRDTPPELQELLYLTGLTNILPRRTGPNAEPATGPDASGFRAKRQPE